jgi:hypothetical protein
MASGRAVLETLEGAGVELALEAKGLRVVKGQLTAELRTLIKDNAAAVKEELQARKNKAATEIVLEVQAALSGHSGATVAKAEEAPVAPPPPPTKAPEPQPFSERSTDDLLLDLALLYRGIADDMKLGINGTEVKVSRLHMETAREALLSCNPVESLGKLGPEVIAAIKVVEYNKRLAELERRGVDMMLYKAAISLLATSEAAQEKVA